MGMFIAGTREASPTKQNKIKFYCLMSATETADKFLHKCQYENKFLKWRHVCQNIKIVWQNPTQLLLGYVIVGNITNVLAAPKGPWYLRKQSESEKTALPTEPQREYVCLCTSESSLPTQFDVSFWV